MDKQFGCELKKSKAFDKNHAEDVETYNIYFKFIKLILSNKAISIHFLTKFVSVSIFLRF